MIFSEYTSDEDRRRLVFERNIIELFIQLPDDILNQVEG